jgi:hypothetical protein
MPGRSCCNKGRASGLSVATNTLVTSRACERSTIACENAGSAAHLCVRGLEGEKDWDEGITESNALDPKSETLTHKLQ